MKTSDDKRKVMVASNRRQILFIAGLALTIMLGMPSLKPHADTPSAVLGPSQVYGQSRTSEIHSRPGQGVRAGAHRLREFHGPIKNRFRVHPVSDRLARSEGALRALRETPFRDFIDMPPAGRQSIAAGYEAAILQTLDLLRQLRAVVDYQLEMELNQPVDRGSFRQPVPRTAAEAERWNHELFGLLEATTEDLEHHAGLLRERFEQVETILDGEWQLRDQLATHIAVASEFEENHGLLQESLNNILIETELPTIGARVEEAIQFLEPKVVDPTKKIEVETPSVCYREPVQASVWEPSEEEIRRAMGLEPPRQHFLLAAPPVPADTSETIDVQITNEIQALADSLETPVAIYEWVRNNIAFQPYFGSWKGSQATLLSKAGNDYDQASLLIALLRALGIPSRYVSGQIDILTNEVTNWLGVRDWSAAGSVLATAGIPVAGNPSLLRLDHVWVEMYVSLADYRGQGAGGYGEEWIHVDPSFKLRDYQTGIPGVDTAVVFDRMGFLSRIHLDLPYEAYVDSVRAYVERTYPGRSAADVPYEGPIVEEDAGLLPLSLPYTVQTVYSESAQLFPSDRYEVDLVVDGGIYGELVSTTLILPEVALSRITLGWNDAGLLDSYARSVFAADGLKIPAYLVNQVPVIRVDGVPVATGMWPVPAGTQVTLRITADNPAGWSNMVTHPYVYAGGYAGVGIHLRQNSSALLEERADSLISAVARIGTPEENQDDILGGFLHLAALLYWKEVEEAEQTIDGIFKYVRVRDVSAGLTNSDDVVTYLFDRPFAVVPDTSNVFADMGIDVKLNWVTAISINDDYSNQAARNQLSGATSSALEHQLWEDLVLIESVSTIKALQVASEDGIPIYEFTPDDCDIIIPYLNLDPEIEAEIWEQVCTYGRRVIVHRDPITLNRWHGVGYISEDMTTGAGSYIIWGGYTGLLAGGKPTGTAEPYGQGEPPVPNYGDPFGTSADPVIFSSGALINSRADLTIPVRGEFPLEVVRSYSTQLDYDGPFGYGWTHNYNQFLVEISSDSVIYFDADGGSKLYVKDLGGDYVVPPGEFVELFETPSGWEIRQKPGRTLAFDTTGTLQSLADRNGNTITLSYSGGKLTSVADPVGRVITLTYNAEDRIEQIEDFTHRTISYTYDAEGNLETFMDLRGGTHTYGYLTVPFAEHNLSSYTDPEGNVTHFDYYASDKAFRLTDAGGGKTGFYYSPFHYETRMVDYLGYESKHRYNDLGCITRITYPDGGVWESEWDSLGQRISVTDQEGYLTEYTYDARRNRDSATDPLLSTATYTYDPTFDLLTHILDKRGNPTIMERDPANGNLLKFIFAEADTTIMIYDAFGNLISTRDGRGNVTTHLYDSNGYHRAMFGASGDTTWTSYDAVGRLTTATDALGNSTAWAWRDGNDIGTIISQTGDSTAFTYDLNGSILTIQNPLGPVAHLGYGPHLRIIRSENALGAITEYRGYDSRCDCRSPLTTRVIDPLGNGGSYVHDFRENPVRLVDGRGIVETRTYDLRGSLGERTDGNGNTIRYAYDRLNRLVAVDYPDGDSEIYRYDANGNMIGAKAASSEIDFSYDRNDRMIRVDNLTIPASLSYTYDKAGNLRTATITGYGTLTYTYNDRNRLVGIHLADGDSIVITRDAVQYPVRISYPNGTHVDYEYDQAHRITSVTHRKRYNVIFAQFIYAFDEVGNRVAITDSGGTTSLDYDDTDELLTVDRPGVSEDETYQYDLGMRRTTDGSVTYRYDEADQLLSYGDITCFYDANGNLIEKSGPQGATTYQYDFEDRLVQVVTPVGDLIEYTYYATGQLASRSLNGEIRRYLYHGINRVAEYDANGNLLAIYIHGPGIDQPLMMMQNGSRYTYHHDGIGSIIALVDDTQTVVQTYRYDAYGNVLTELNQGFENPYAFTGRVWEKDNGLYYYRTRFYDPKTGRFLSRDPLGFLTGTYLYGYVNNNPVNAIDPLGLWNIIIGGGVSLAGGMGCEGSGGIVISFWERKFDIGVFGSVGASGGLNVSGDLFAGWVKGGTNDLAGTTGNINVTGGPVSLTSFHDPKTGEWLGGTIGAGPGATPVGGSVAISITGKITIRDIARWIDGLLK